MEFCVPQQNQGEYSRKPGPVSVRPPGGWSADMDVRPGGASGHGTTKSDKRNSRFAKLRHERFSLDAVRMQRNIDCVAVIEIQSVMSSRLTERGHGQAHA